MSNAIESVIRDAKQLSRQVERLAAQINLTAWIVNVKDFGAKGDGVTDDYAAIMAAIAVAEVAGGVVYFPPGTYMISHKLWIHADNVKLLGASRYLSTIKMMAGVQEMLLYVSAENAYWPSGAAPWLKGFECRELGWDGDYPTGQGLCVGYGTGTKSLDTGTGLSAIEQCGIQVMKGDMPVIVDCYFKNTLSGAVSLTTCRGGVVDDNYAYHCAIGDWPGSRNVLQACYDDDTYYPQHRSTRFSFCRNTIFGFLDLGIGISLMGGTHTTLVNDNVIVGDPTLEFTAYVAEGTLRQPGQGNAGGILHETTGWSHYNDVPTGTVISGNSISHTGSGIGATSRLFSTVGDRRQKGTLVTGNNISNVRNLGIYLDGDGATAVGNVVDGYAEDLSFTSGYTGISVRSPADFGDAGVVIQGPNITGNTIILPMVKALAGQPVLTGSTDVIANPFGFDCRVTVASGTVTVIKVGGVTQTIIHTNGDPAHNATCGQFRVNQGSSMAVTYSVKPLWRWEAWPESGHEIGSPAMGASTAHVTNDTGFDCEVELYSGTVTEVQVNGVVQATTQGRFDVPSGEYIEITYSVEPLWRWWAIGAIRAAVRGISLGEDYSAIQQIQGGLVADNVCYGPGKSAQATVPTSTTSDGISVYGGWSKVALRNNHSEGWLQGIRLAGSSVTHRVVDIDVSHNTCTRNLDNGIYLYYNCDNIRLQTNTCTDNSQGGSTWGVYRTGIAIVECTTARLEDNICRDFQAVPTQQYGIRLGTATGVILKGGDLRGNAVAAVNSWTGFAQILNVLTEDYYPALTEQLSAWVAYLNQNPSLGTLPANCYVSTVRVHVTVGFDSDGTDLLTLGYDADPDAFMASLDVSTIGVKATTLGTLNGVNTTSRAVEAYYVNGGSEPTVGKALVTLEYYRVPATPTVWASARTVTSVTAALKATTRRSVGSVRAVLS